MSSKHTVPEWLQATHPSALLTVNTATSGGPVSKSPNRSRGRRSEAAARQPTWFAGQASKATEGLSVPEMRLASDYARLCYVQADKAGPDSQIAMSHLFFSEAMEKAYQARLEDEPGALTKTAIDVGSAIEAEGRNEGEP